MLSAHRKVFFTDYGQIPKVERCDMDGQNRTKLVDSKIVFPHGITLDLVSRLVYWADAYLDYIEVVDYEGKGRQIILRLSAYPGMNCLTTKCFCLKVKSSLWMHTHTQLDLKS